jgi:hypothetical protein
VPFNDIARAATDEEEFSYSTRKVLSILLLGFAVVLSLMSYSGKRFIFFNASYSISPDLISGVLALFLVIPLYARGILRWSSSVYGTLMFVMFLSVYASLAKLALLGKGDIQIYLITAAIVLSWLGMRTVAGIGWVLAFVAAVLSALTTSAAMGINGFLFITSAFLGLLMHSNLSPASAIEEIKDEYAKAGSMIGGHIRADVDEVKKKLD